ncbi:TetR/AcrR family transcriptional regulator [Rhizobium sp. FKL33]|jgi:AcrR family transcriptional regulator|uniref:TetR/AcrR family transcriptional regulator n=1 Tax=Rhizobium sp. FKL33 TaxID=2562307 RepID=UPI001484CD3B|nr:TetR/AcrR family transcriptional regulator [Rhizobium sp. FKL33]
MPKTWVETLDGHREAVRHAAINAAMAIASEIGLQKVSMSEVASRTGITRATLYKYFTDVDAIFVEWHRRMLEHHLAHVEVVAGKDGAAVDRLTEILLFFAMTARRHHGTRFAEALRDREHARAAEERLVAVVEEVVAGGIDAGTLRADLSPREAAVFLQGSLSGVHRLPDEAAVKRLVGLLVDFVSVQT